MKGKLSRRHRLLWKTLATSLVALAGAGLFVFYRRASIHYDPGERVEGITAELERHLPADYPRVAFTEVARQSGVSFQHFYRARSTQLPEDMGSGAAWGDYDNDGDDDLFLVNVSGPLTLDQEEALRSPAMCKLYENIGRGSFVDVTERSRLGLRICGMGVAWGDYDGDGWLDVAVSSYPDLYLFRNNRDGTFADVTAASGFGRFKGFWAGLSWADHDKDGDLDLYVCGYVRS
jgi:hypothetical protein